MIGKLKITIVASHSFPIPYKIHTGDIVILNLADKLSSMAHEITVIAPKGTIPVCPNVKILEMKASYGSYPPSSEECEEDAFIKYRDILHQQDIVHDFSVSKRIVEALWKEGKRNVASTLMGGAWTYRYPPKNLIVWSKSHRDRVLRGATDFEGTETPDLAGHTGRPVAEAHVVHGGVDTDFYTPYYEKKDYFLWLGRWHSARGYRLAIDLARKTGINLIMSGEHPDNEVFASQRSTALDAVRYADGLKNVTFRYLPPDPHHHTAKLKLLQEAKGFLMFPKFQEPFGLSQVEALSCGTPVIGTRYGSVPEVIDKGVGIVCNDSIDELTEAVECIGNIDYKECRKRAVESFDSIVMAKNYLQQYQIIIDGNGWTSDEN